MSFLYRYPATRSHSVSRARQQPFAQFDQLFNQLNRQFFADTGPSSEVTLTPKVDIIEQADSYQLAAELPGVDRDNISVSVDDSVLTISASNEASSLVQQADADQSDDKDSGHAEVDNTQTVLRSERHSGRYSRSFTLGDSIDQENIQASFNNGLLVLTVPKVAAETPVKQTIEIH